MTGESFIDVDFCQQAKHGQRVPGDVFLSRKIVEEHRIVSVLSDGLGSGVKASVLANLTATMALRYTSAFVDVRESAKTIMDTLPVCEQRKISYSTFTIVDVDQDGRTRVIEHGNPPLLVVRGTELIPLRGTEITLEGWKDRTIRHSEFNARLGDRIIFYSDGVSQSGMGRCGYPLGWGNENVARFIAQQIDDQSDISALELSRRLLARALENDDRQAKDDITCGVVHFRRPQRLLVVTGPPFRQERDEELASAIRDFQGRKAICGGTTANIVSRLLNRPVTISLATSDAETPPASQMEGVDLVTEGTITLAKAVELLDRPGPLEGNPNNPARALAALMLESDIVEFLVGTRINEAHQDPAVPVELDLRRNIVRRLTNLLELRYVKETRVRYL